MTNKVLKEYHFSTLHFTSTHEGPMFQDKSFNYIFYLKTLPLKLLLLCYEIGYGEGKVQIKYIKYFVPVRLLFVRDPWSVSVGRSVVENISF